MRKRGSVTKLEDGRFWARAPRQADGSRPSLGYFPAEEEAWRAIKIDVARLPEHTPDVGTTFLSFGKDILDERELNGVRGIEQERTNFDAHLATAKFANKPLTALDGDDGSVEIAAWIRAMMLKKRTDGKGLLAKSTIQRVLSLASAIFDEAGPQGRGLMKRNPCLGKKVKRRVGEAETKEKWTFFMPHEREWFSLPRATSNGYVREVERLCLLFGEGSGIRQGEQFHLRLDDMHEVTGKCTCAGWADRPHAVIRFGSKGLPRKNGKILIVPLFGYALEVAKAWRRRLPSFCPDNPHGLVWPLPSGSRRARGKPFGNGRYIACENGTHVFVKEKPKKVGRGGTHRFVDRWKEVLRIAGITRNVRWHDVRHSCASALIQGQLGDAWSLEEIQGQLGHSSITVTQKYAHLGETSLKKAASKVRVGTAPAPSSGGEVVSTNGGAGSSVAAITNDLLGVEQRGIEPLTSALRTRNTLELLRGLAAEKADSNQLLTNLANTLAALLEREPT